MKITIMDLKIIGGATVVNFSSDLGCGIVKWGGGDKPNIGYEYDVEIDIGKTIDEIYFSNNENKDKYLISSNENFTFINGKIESIDEDGMVYLRLAQDCLIMIESVNSKINQGDWIGLNIMYEDIEIFAQGNSN